MTRYPGLDLERDQRGRSPPKKQIPNTNEGVVCEGLRENVGLLHLGSTVTKGNSWRVRLEKRLEVVELQSNVLGARSELVGLCHANARLIVFVDCTDEAWRANDNREELVNLLKERHQWNGFSERLRESDVFRLCCAESDLCLEFGDC